MPPVHKSVIWIWECNKSLHVFKSHIAVTDLCVPQHFLNVLYVSFDQLIFYTVQSVTSAPTQLELPPPTTPNKRGFISFYNAKAVIQVRLMYDCAISNARWPLYNIRHNIASTEKTKFSNVFSFK